MDTVSITNLNQIIKNKYADREFLPETVAYLNEKLSYVVENFQNSDTEDLENWMKEVMKEYPYMTSFISNILKYGGKKYILDKFFDIIVNIILSNVQILTINIVTPFDINTAISNNSFTKFLIGNFTSIAVKIKIDEQYPIVKYMGYELFMGIVYASMNSSNILLEISEVKINKNKYLNINILGQKYNIYLLELKRNVRFDTCSFVQGLNSAAEWRDIDKTLIWDKLQSLSTGQELEVCNN